MELLGARADEACHFRCLFAENAGNLAGGACQNLGDFIGARVQAVVEFLETGIEAAFQHLLAGAECGRQREGMVAQRIAEAVDAGIEDAVNGFRAAIHRLADTRQAFHQLAVERADAVFEGFGEFGNAVVEDRRQLIDRGLQPFLEEPRAKVEIHDGVVDARLQRLAEAGALFLDRAVELGEHVVQRSCQRAVAAGQGIVDVAGTGDQGFVELLGALVEGGVQALGILVERRGAGFELLQHRRTALVQRDVQLFQTGIEFVGEGKTGGIQRLQQGFGAGVEKIADRFGGGVRLFHQHGRARVDQRGEGFARGREAKGDFLRRKRHVFLELLVGAGDRGADALDMADDRLALAAQLLDQAAHAHFIVGIAALQRIDLGMDEGFQLGGTGDGALYALVHRHDFAAHGLTDGHDALGGDGFRVGEAQGNFRHGTGGIAQILGAGDHDREGVEQKQRQKRSGKQRAGAGKGEEIRERTELPEPWRIEKLRQRKAAEHPERADDRRHAQGGFQRTAVQRFHDAGGGAAAGVVGRRGRGALALCRFGRGAARRLGSALTRLVHRRLLRLGFLTRRGLVVAKIDLQGVFKRLICLFVDRLVVLVVRHTIYASLHIGFVRIVAGTAICRKRITPLRRDCVPVTVAIPHSILGRYPFFGTKDISPTPVSTPARAADGKTGIFQEYRSDTFIERKQFDAPRWAGGEGHC